MAATDDDAFERLIADAQSKVLVYLINETLPSLGVTLGGYSSFVQIALSSAFGYLIVSGFSNVVSWSLRKNHAHSTAVAVKNMLTIVGMGGLAAAKNYGPIPENW